MGGERDTIRGDPVRAQWVLRDMVRGPRVRWGDDELFLSMAKAFWRIKAWSKSKLSRDVWGKICAKIFGADIAAQNCTIVCSLLHKEMCL